MSNIIALPGVELPAREPGGLNLTPEEVREAAGGYKRPKDQLRELHARGFSRAFISKVTGRVVLERAHHEAVTRGQFGAPASNQAAVHKPAGADIAGLNAFFKRKRG